MNKKILAGAALIVSSFAITQSVGAIPPPFQDVSFYQCTIDNYNNNAFAYRHLLPYKYNIGYNDELSNTDIEYIFSMDCSSRSIYEVDGLERMASLHTLDLTHNFISEIELPGRFGNDYSFLIGASYYGLQELYLSNNRLNSINLLSVPNLKVLDVTLNPLNSLDVSPLPYLRELYAADLNLQEIDLSNNQELESLNLSRGYGSGSGLNVDLSSNPKLKTLRMNGLGMTTLDISNNPELTEVHALNNNLSKLDITNNPNINMVVADDNTTIVADLQGQENGNTITFDLSALNFMEYVNYDMHLKNDPDFYNRICPTFSPIYANEPGCTSARRKYLDLEDSEHYDYDPDSGILTVKDIKAIEGAVKIKTYDPNMGWHFYDGQPHKIALGNYWTDPNNNQGNTIDPNANNNGSAQPNGEPRGSSSTQAEQATTSQESGLSIPNTGQAQKSEPGTKSNVLAPAIIIGIITSLVSFAVFKRHIKINK